MTNWVITGGAGFIGKNLIGKLLQQGDNNIRIVDNLHNEEALSYINWPYQCHENTSPQPWKSDLVDLYVHDIMDREFACQVCDGADVIVHLAANTGVAPSIEHPFLDCETNVLGTLNYLDAARKNQVAKFVFASSGAPAGACEPPITENIVPAPLSPYGASKLSGEGYCSAYYHSFGVNTTALRFSNVYGPLSKHKASVVASFINAIYAGKSLTVFGDGSQTRDYIYVGDLINAIHKAATTHDVGGEIFQVATGMETSVNTLLSHIKSLIEDKSLSISDIEHLPRRTGDMLRNYADVSKIKSRLGWEPTVSLEDGLSQTLKWFELINIKRVQSEH